MEGVRHRVAKDASYIQSFYERLKAECLAL